MNTLENIEKIGRQAWLASLGAYGVGWKYAIEKFDSSYEKTNALLNDFLVEGGKVENKLQSKLQVKEVFDNKITSLKNKLGLSEFSDVERVEQLIAKVDSLMVVVSKLSEEKTVTVTKAVGRKSKSKVTVKKTTAKTSK